MATFTITSVNPQTRQYDTKFGPMVSYQLMLTNPDGTPVPQAVEVSQKTTTPAPAVGGTLEGMIDMSGQYGPKFKKDFQGGGGNFGGSPSSVRSDSGTATNQTGSSKGFNSDPFTMYLSYAKDIVVALVGSKEGYDPDKFIQLLDDVAAGGKTLYDGRPGNEKAEKAAEPVKAAETKPVDDRPVDIQDIPW